MVLASALRERALGCVGVLQGWEGMGLALVGVLGSGALGAGFWGRGGETTSETRERHRLQTGLCLREIVLLGALLSTTTQ